MISTFSSTIRRKEMDAVLTCLVDEKIGPGEMNTKLTQSVKDFLSIAGCVALRSPEIALNYAIRSLNLDKNSKIMISALAPSWQYFAVKSLGFEPIVLDVSEETGLVTAEFVQEGKKQGSSVLILHESMGILPNSSEFNKLLELNVFIIEDISHSLGSEIDLNNVDDSESSSEDAVENIENIKINKNVKKAGSFGVFSIRFGRK